MLGEKKRRAAKIHPITVGEKTKIVKMRPITLLGCFVCLIGLSVAATYFAHHAKYKKQSDNKDQEILNFQKNNKSLSDANIELQNSLQKLKNEYSKLESPHKDLEAARDDALKLRDELDAKSSEIQALNVDQQTLEQKYNGLKEMLAPYLILEPTLVGSGETTMVFDGNLGIVLYEAADTNKCYEDSAAVCYLINGPDKKKLCLQTGKPESFKYQSKRYLFNLLESKGSEGAHRYLISILKER